MKKNTSQKSESSQEAARRKRDHVKIVLEKDAVFKEKSNGFELYDFVHNALPELNYSEVDCSTSFLGKSISLPLLVSCMTGGFEFGKKINKQLAEVCEEVKIPLGVGSQRILLESSTHDGTFSVVRDVAPSIPIIGNIGGPEVARLANGDYSISQFKRLVSVINADAFVVHLNPLQELLQPEGNTNFRGVQRGIQMLVDSLECPIMIKEVGAGLSSAVIKRLYSVGVRYVDVAGAGGTSWAGVELMRSSDENRLSNEKFWDWGIPTAEALHSAVALKKKHKNLHITASGGIHDGFTAAKAIAIGADLVGSARVFLQELVSTGQDGLIKLIQVWGEELRRVMFLTGSATLEDFQNAPVLVLRKNFGIE